MFPFCCRVGSGKIREPPVCVCAEGPHEEKCPVTAAASSIAYSTVSNAGWWIRASYNGFPYAIETIFAFFAFCTEKGALLYTVRDWMQHSFSRQKMRHISFSPRIYDIGRISVSLSRSRGNQEWEGELKSEKRGFFLLGQLSEMGGNGSLRRKKWEREELGISRKWPLQDFFTASSARCKCLDSYQVHSWKKIMQEQV